MINVGYRLGMTAGGPLMTKHQATVDNSKKETDQEVRQDSYCTLECINYLEIFFLLWLLQSSFSSCKEWQCLWTVNATKLDDHEMVCSDNV